MGVVYLAHDPRLGRHVAVKCYRPPHGLPAEQTADYHQRFLREARAAANLTHPGIVTIYDVDEDSDGDAFIAMEYVPGRSLREWIEEQGRIEPDRSFAITAALCDALSAAHRAGIVHRDVKPANILIREPDGEVKITDFGVARLPGSHLTRAGATLGTPAYMSPEQVSGNETDARSDLFSLAVILYECLCGERPFGGPNLAALADAVLSDEAIPITTRVEGIPASLDAFFDRALAKDPKHRFPSATEFRAGLDRALGAGAELGLATVLEAPSPARRRVRSPTRAWLMAGVALLFVLGAWGLWTGTEEGPASLPEPKVSDTGVFDTPEPKQVRRVEPAKSRPTPPVRLAVSPRPRAEEKAYLHLDVTSSVKAGTLTLLLDRQPVYSRELSATDGKRRFFGKDRESFETTIEATPGMHQVVAYVGPAGPEAGDLIEVELEPNETRNLRLVAGRAFGKGVSLRAERVARAKTGRKP